ncbi:aldose epimerase family protein [Catenovulum adriaticum]|uniref:Aldose 1-epimerase n=1 Tax=Catenovulum adriaticum TaxID=2984846 RepID=A0ABY7ARL5_9ALTE|nr:aldose epimerase family protein [Catenovulum sp. TS8]WAJ71766.1 galactose mutarotase [Catenovulum sp. TS8]
MSNTHINLAVSLIIVMGMSACSDNNQTIKIEEINWGQTAQQNVHKYTLTNTEGMSVQLTNWGATVIAVNVPNHLGQVENVILGYENAERYLNDCCYTGPVVGRFGNRIANGRFTIDETTYQVTRNDGPDKNLNQLHGGLKGLHKRLWKSEIVNNKVVMSYQSPDGEEGYPGLLDIKVTYSLDNNNRFTIDYLATTTKATPVNLTWHAYFNLSGDMKRSVESQNLYINSDKITPVNNTLIPTGEFMSVKNTPFDFNQPKPVGQDIRVSHPQLKLGGGQDAVYGGYDHNWVLNDYDGSLKHQVTLTDPQSGRLMKIFTTEPGMQFYSGNFMDGSVKNALGKPINHRDGLALEPQHFPDSPNHPHFPNSILRPGETYQSTSVYEFSLLTE